MTGKLLARSLFCTVALVGIAAAATPAPALDPRGDWVNSAPTTLQAQRGKVVLLGFWTRECINCKHVTPYWNEWFERFGRAGDFTVLSVHTPELPEERTLAGVRAAVREKGLRFPVVTDNSRQDWTRFGIEAWPTTLLIDKHGRIRDRWEGELNYENSGLFQRVQAEIEALRHER